MGEYMTEEEYRTYVRLQDKFVGCLERCAVEISWMEYKREPKGEFCVDSELYDGGRYMVQFEIHHCGESGYDTVFVPITYMYDEGYREHYGRHLENVRQEKEEAKELEKHRIEYINAIYIEEKDREEYERLKIKYGEVDTLEELG